jgi:pimeloyl-ACP methyl ester carboxylesterase
MGGVTTDDRHTDVKTDANAAAAIAGRGLAATTAAIGDLHAAISARVFSLTGRPAAPVRVVHDGISKGVYAAVGGGARAASYAAGQVVAAVATRRARTADYLRLADRPRSDIVVGALNGAWGDSFTRWRNPLALTMTVRVDGHDVAPTAAGLRDAYPQRSGDLVVFLPGLCETERAWWVRAEDHYADRTSSHGSRLAAETGAVPVYLRYNTGLHISDNGEQLATLLTELVAHWPVEVTRLTLIGHSMGGLVIRAACCHGQERDEPWVGLVRRVVYLGAPHLGAPLEVAATAAGVALRKLPETRPLAAALASRSVGIKDLRYGDVRPTDWADIRDPDAWRAEPAHCAPLLETAEHYYIGATLSRDQDHFVARMIGDALVTFPSASGKGPRRELALDVDRGRHLGGLHHFDLLNHPRVWALMRDWLVETPR